MINRWFARSMAGPKVVRRAIPLALLFLLIEFFDELNYGIQGAVLPSLRRDLGLDYAQIGLLLGLPHALNTFIEPALMLFGDTRLRKGLVIAGGLVIALSLLLTAGAHSFPLVLLAFVIGFPSSGAFVTLSQATLMDLNPGREAQMMARWTVAGSLGNLFGPLLVAGGFALALGWRWSYLALTGLCLALVLLVVRQPFPAQRRLEDDPDSSRSDFAALLPNLWVALRNLGLLRWLALLEFADLMLDVYAGYVALYFADVIGLSPAQVGVLLSALMAASLCADLLLVPLLERFPGRRVVRISAAITALLYPAWLLLPWPPVKIALAIALRLSTLGWYPVLQGEAYAAMPGRSGTVMAVNSLAGPLSGALVWLVGWAAERAGLPQAMWLLWLGPLVLLFGLPRECSKINPATPPAA